MVDPARVHRTTARTAPRTGGTAPEGAGENARERRRACRVRGRVGAEARAAATAALHPPVGGEAMELEAAMEAAREAARRLNEALEGCSCRWNDAVLRAMLPLERRACAAGDGAGMEVGAGGAGGTDGADEPEEGGDGAREAGIGSTPVEATSDASMGDTRSKPALGEEPGEANDGVGPAEEAAAAIVIGAGWSEVAGPSVKEELEGF